MNAEPDELYFEVRVAEHNNLFKAEIVAGLTSKSERFDNISSNEYPTIKEALSDLGGRVDLIKNL